VSDFVPVTKDSEQEQRVPTVWRTTLGQIAERFLVGNYRLEDIAGVTPVSEARAESIQHNIATYGEPLTDLHDTTWQTSVCMWQNGYWEALVDLFTSSGRSDLAIDVRVHEDTAAPQGYRFDIRGVYVP
jgi:hypothetical protein